MINANHYYQLWRIYDHSNPKYEGVSDNLLCTSNHYKEIAQARDEYIEEENGSSFDYKYLIVDHRPRPLQG